MSPQQPKIWMEVYTLSSSGWKGGGIKLTLPPLPSFKLVCEKKITFSVTAHIFKLQRPEEGNWQPRVGRGDTGERRHGGGVVVEGNAAGSQRREVDAFDHLTVGQGKESIRKWTKKDLPSWSQVRGERPDSLVQKSNSPSWKPRCNVTGPGCQWGDHKVHRPRPRHKTIPKKEKAGTQPPALYQHMRTETEEAT